MRLVGFTVTPEARRPGSPLNLHSVRQIVQTTPALFKNFIHLLGAPKADGSWLENPWPFCSTGWADPNSDRAST